MPDLTKLALRLHSRLADRHYNAYEVIAMVGAVGVADALAHIVRGL